MLTADLPVATRSCASPPVLTFANLFQQPYFFQPSPLVVNPRLAAEIAYVVRREDHPFYRYEALITEPAHDYGSGRQESGSNHGFGASFNDPAEALAKSVFEAWERKFSKVYDPAQLIAGSYEALAERAVDPNAFTRISDWEYQQSPLDYIRYSPDLNLSWKECYRVCNRVLEPVLIPATLVYSRYSWKHPRERFVPNLSPGLACHATLREAFFGGLCELLERDAFMLAWLHRRSPPRIRPETIAFDEAAEAIDYFNALGFLFHFLDLTTDVGIPVILTLIEHPDLPWNGTIVPGLGCALDPHVALRKSLLEALIMLANHVTVDHLRSKLTLQERPLPYSLQPDDYYRKVRFLLENEQQTAIQDLASHDRKDPGRNVEFLVGHLADLGHTTYFVDLTPPGYEDSRICLTRAMVTGLQPMLYEPDCWRLNAQRLFGDGPPAFERLNVMPHPFMLME